LKPKIRSLFLNNKNYIDIYTHSITQKIQIMANVISVTVYQINQKPLAAAGLAMGFPGTGCLLRDCSTSSTKVLPNGVTVNSSIQLADGSQYYCTQTLAALITLFNA
jgi:hypothetical protein